MTLASERRIVLAYDSISARMYVRLSSLTFAGVRLESLTYLSPRVEEVCSDANILLAGRVHLVQQFFLGSVR